MYKKAILSIYQSRNVLNRPHDSLFHVFRAFGSAGVCLCEKKEGTTGPSSVEVRKDGERTEQREDNKAGGVASGEQKGRGGGGLEGKEASHPAVTRKAEPAAESEPEPSGEAQSPDWMTEVQTEAAHEKEGKKGLLELLGAMKVEVVSKRRLKAPRVPRVGPAGPQQMESTSSMFQQATGEVPTHRESLSPELVAAASAAASTLPNSSQAKSELLQQLRKHESISQEERKGETRDIGNIIADMKVGKRPNGRLNARPANQIRFDDDGRGYTHDRGITGELDGVRRRKSPFSVKRLNIFLAAAEQETDSDLATPPTLWDTDLANQIVQAVNQQPRNGFEEMIQWTRQGKLWQFPIDNEAGLEEEASVPFHDHVFLERHLEDGFPQQGPIRHFMELVVTGLSKNHHLTVTQKLEHLAWFRDYFQQKQEILKEAESY